MNKFKLDKFFAQIEREWNWRNKELLSFNQALAFVDEYQEGSLARAGVLLLYAHWEGFVKRAGQFFLEAFSQEPIKAVPVYIIAAHLSKMNADIEKRLAKGNRPHELLACLSDGALVCSSLDDALETKSNLNSEVLGDILRLVGISSSCFDTRFNYIDRNFVALRHQIAHGEGRPVTKDEYRKLYKDVLELLEIFQGKILDSAIAANEFLESTNHHSCLKLLQAQ